MKICQWERISLVERLSADADEFEEGRKSYRRINLVGQDRRTGYGYGYGDCKVRFFEVNRDSFGKSRGEAFREWSGQLFVNRRIAARLFATCQLQLRPRSALMLAVTGS